MVRRLRSSRLQTPDYRPLLLLLISLFPALGFGGGLDRVAFLPLRNVREGAEMSREGTAMARYLARNVHILRDIEEIPAESAAECLRAHSSRDLERLLPSEMHSVSRCIEADEIIWGTYEPYTDRVSFRIDYWLRATGAIRHFEVSGTREAVFDTLDRGILDLAEQGQWGVTREEKARLAERDVDSFPVFMDYTEARHLYATEEYEPAVEKFRAVLEGNPEFRWARLLLGNCLVQMEKVEEAEGIYRALTESETPFLPAYANLGAVQMAMKKPWRAVSVYRRALKQFKDSPILYYNLGNARFALEQDVETREAFKKAIELDPGFAEPYYQLAVYYQSRDVIGKAREYSAEARRRRPDLTADLIEHMVPLKSILMDERKRYRPELDFAAVGLPEPGKKD